MISAILAAFCLILVLGVSGFWRGRITEMQAWGIVSHVIAISPDGKLLATSAGPRQRREIDNSAITSNTTVKLYAFPDDIVVRTVEAFYVSKLAFRER